MPLWREQGYIYYFVYSPLYANVIYNVCTVRCIDFNIVDRFGKVQNEYILEYCLLFKDVTGVAVLNDLTLATKIKFAVPMGPIIVCKWRH
jgi:hypothetical protein